LDTHVQGAARYCKSGHTESQVNQQSRFALPVSNFYSLTAKFKFVATMSQLTKSVCMQGLREIAGFEDS
jgi:hypothetical protein